MDAVVVLVIVGALVWGAVVAVRAIRKGTR